MRQQWGRVRDVNAITPTQAIFAWLLNYIHAVFVWFSQTRIGCCRTNAVTSPSVSVFVVDRVLVVCFGN